MYILDSSQLEKAAIQLLNDQSIQITYQLNSKLTMSLLSHPTCRRSLTKHFARHRRFKRTVEIDVVRITVRIMVIARSRLTARMSFDGDGTSKNKLFYDIAKATGLEWVY